MNFATGANHPAGAQPDDSRCSTCHIPQGASDFDASIIGAHVVPTESSALSGLAATIQSVTNGTAGSKPVVTFTLKDKKGNGVPTSALGSLSLTMAGPTADYGYRNFGSDVVDTPGYVTESATNASCSAAGVCVYTFTHAVPAGSLGTYAIALEARRTETVFAGNSEAAKHPVWSREPCQLFLRRWVARNAATQRSGVEQLQPMPCESLAAWNASEQHRVLRDVPQPVEHGRHDADERNQPRR